MDLSRKAYATRNARGKVLFGLDEDCGFTARMRFNKNGHLMGGRSFCPLGQVQGMSTHERTLLHRALQGEAINTVTTKRCLCGVIRLAVVIMPVGDGDVKVSIEGLEKVASPLTAQWKRP